MREACEMTFMGESKQSLSSIYKSEHSPARTQLFWVRAENIPLFVATHLIRHHVGSIPFQLTCRPDKNGGNNGFIEKINHIIKLIQDVNDHFAKGGQYTGIDADKINEAVGTLEWLTENADRQTPVNLGLCLNAQALINMAKMRLCCQASIETRLIFSEIKKKVRAVDPDLANLMVRNCVYRNGLCGEPRCCGFNSTPAFNDEAESYRALFTKKQKGMKE